MSLVKLNNIRIDFLKLPTRDVTSAELFKLMISPHWIDTHRYVKNKSYIENGEVGILNGVRYIEKND